MTAPLDDQLVAEHQDRAMRLYFRSEASECQLFG
jgi:hypothetical protein